MSRARALNSTLSRAERAVEAAINTSDFGELLDVFLGSPDEEPHVRYRKWAEDLRKLAHNRRDSLEYRKAIAYAYAAIMLQRLAAELGNQ